MDAVIHTGSEAPEPAEIIARARAMIPTLAKRSFEGRRQRRIPDETIADMQHAGFFRVLQPRRWGGYEMEIGTFYDIQLALAEGGMSTACRVHYFFSGLASFIAASTSAMALHRSSASRFNCANDFSAFSGVVPKRV